MEAVSSCGMAGSSVVLLKLENAKLVSLSYSLLHSGSPCATMVTRIYKSGDGGAVGTVGNAITSLRSKKCVDPQQGQLCTVRRTRPPGKEWTTSERLD